MRKLRKRIKRKRYVIAFSFSGLINDDWYYTGQSVRDNNVRLFNFSRDLRDAEVFTKRPAEYWVIRLVKSSDYRCLQHPSEIFNHQNLTLKEVEQETVLV